MNGEHILNHEKEGALSRNRNEAMVCKSKDD